MQIMKLFIYEFNSINSSCTSEKFTSMFNTEIKEKKNYQLTIIYNLIFDMKEFKIIKVIYY